MPTVAANLVTRDQVKDFLSISEATNDAKLDSFIAAASQMIQNKVGVLWGTATVDEWHDGGSDRIVLRNSGPIASVTSVLESYGSIVYTLTQVSLDAAASGNAYQYTVDLNSGLIVRRASGVAVQFAAGIQNVHATYVTATTAPADVQHAGLVLIKHLWTTQRGPQGKTGAIPEGMSYSFPNRVLEILSPYIVPGIA